MIELILPPLLLGIILCVVSGPLGCFIIWRRMAYFGDTIAHAALLGVGLSVLLKLEYLLLSIVVCCAVSGLLSIKSRIITSDASLGVIAHGGLALGLLTIGASSESTSISAVLLGDILASSMRDVFAAAILACLLIGLLYFQWKPLLLSAIDENLAQTEGCSPGWSKFLLMVSISLTVAFGIQLVGALLVSSLLIIPASAARFLSRSPEGMAITASCIGVISVITGIGFSAFIDAPSGPSIVTAALMLFIIVTLIAKYAKK